MEDMMEVCRELGIACEGDALGILSEKDIFLIEKKIEAIKKRKIQRLKKRPRIKKDKTEKEGSRIKDLG